MAYQNYSAVEYESFGQMLCGSAEKFGGRKLIEAGEKSLTYAEFASKAEALAVGFATLGVRGKNVMICGENSPEWLLAFFGVSLAGGVAVPVDRNAQAGELEAIAQKSDPSLLVCAPCVSRRAEGLEDVEILTFPELEGLEQTGRTAMENGENPICDLVADPDALRVILFSPGAQKGVMLSERNLCFDAFQVCKMVKLQPSDVFLSVLPLHHAYELTCGFLCPFQSGAAVAFSAGLRYLSREMTQIQPTVMNCVPNLMETMLSKVWSGIRRQQMEKKIRAGIRTTNLIRPEAASFAAKRVLFSDLHKSFGGHLRLILSGGAKSNPDVLRGFRDLGILALQCYTMVECSPVAAINRDRHYNDGAAGLSLPDGLLDVYDMQDDGIGEIRYKGKNVMLGYYRAPELTAELLRDGWFYTGDLGMLDREGFLTITGKKKNRILLSSGKSVFPEELESLLVRSPFVCDAVVVGRFNQEKKDYDVVALLRPDASALRATGDSDLRTRTDVEMHRAISEVNAKVASYKRISSFELRDEEFPKSPSGTVLRDLI